MLRRTLSFLAAFTLFGAGIALLSSTPASSGGAPAITVDRFDDASEDDCTSAPDDCSLSGAFNHAEVEHVDGVTVDITVPAGEYVLEDHVHIEEVNANVHGAGAGATVVTIDRPEEDPLVRHLDLVTEGELILTLSDMTFVGGNGDQEDSAGGSILAQGGAHLTLERMHFVDNEIRGFGGAIAFYGNPSNNTLEIEDSTFEDNSATQLGGAIHLDQGETATITNTTFTGNVAAAGGALFVGNEDGEPTEATLTHVTMADNGLLVRDLQVQGEEEEETLGGAIGVGDNGTVSLEGTVIERSVEAGVIQPSAVGDPVANCWASGGGEIVSDGHNVVDDLSCDLDEDTDKEDTAADTQALDDNGGPTPTMALLADSAAVDAAGSAERCSVDADPRGIARPQDGNDDDVVACDSGAYERPAPEPPAAQPAQETPDFTG